MRSLYYQPELIYWISVFAAIFFTWAALSYLQMVSGTPLVALGGGVLSFLAAIMSLSNRRLRSLALEELRKHVGREVAISELASRLNVREPSFRDLMVDLMLSGAVRFTYDRRSGVLRIIEVR